MAGPAVVYCVRDLTTGDGQAFKAGQILRADDPVVKRMPSFFSSDPSMLLVSSIPFDQYPPPEEPESRVEEMTAEPGRGRNVRLPREQRG